MKGGAAGAVMDINSRVSSLAGVGKKKSGIYEKLGITTIDDLIGYFPRKYIDYSEYVSIDEAEIGSHSVICAEVSKIMPAAKLRAGLILYKAVITDGKSEMTVSAFNNPYLINGLMTGKEYLFYGKVNGNFIRKEMNTPQIIDKNDPHMIRPIYKLTEGLTSAGVMRDMETSLRLVGDNYPDYLPDFLRNEFSLPEMGYTLHNIHFPESSHAMEISRRRIAFDELLTLRLGLKILKVRNRSTTGYIMKNSGLKDFYSGLPFELTNAQKKACAEIASDLGKEYPMNRLIQGDVGSGKTAVAAAACYIAVKNGAQAALMAPTEILARQHYETLSGFLTPFGIKVDCLTGSNTPKQKADIKERLKSGEINVITGTHALISESTEFKSMGLVITDEQHRFGVNQRKTLAEKGESPHKLVMSATPIPRTLALMIYGDLDISILNELPKGRKPVKTYAVTGKLRERALGFVKGQLDLGRQGYIVCPLVEDNEDGSAKAAVSYKENLENGFFSGYTVGLLHGQMNAAEKDKAMQKFKSGETRLLVCTTVVEVGVDVPNATIILIENADRFGLSQLHQLRGRVGRGEYESSCILVTDNPTDETRERLKIMTEISDGFQISEKDLKFRGAGDFFGERQHGLPKFKIADMVNDRELLYQAQQAAEELISRSPELDEYPMLKERIEKMFSENAENGMN